MKRTKHLLRELALYVLFGSITLVIVTALAALILTPIMFSEGPMR